MGFGAAQVAFAGFVIETDEMHDLFTFTRLVQLSRPTAWRLFLIENNRKKTITKSNPIIQLNALQKSNRTCIMRNAQMRIMRNKIFIDQKSTE